MLQMVMPATPSNESITEPPSTVQIDDATSDDKSTHGKVVLGPRYLGVPLLDASSKVMQYLRLFFCL